MANNADPNGKTGAPGTASDPTAGTAPDPTAGTASNPTAGTAPDPTAGTASNPTAGTASGPNQNSQGGQVSESDTSKYFGSLVQTNTDYLNKYYALFETHINRSYRISMVMGIMGFVFIVIGLVIGLVVSRTGDENALLNENALIVGYIASASGVIIEFIAGVFFYLYNKAVRQLKEYHDGLLDEQNILLSFKMVDGTLDNQEKAEMVTQMISALLASKHSDE